ncbi:MAG: ABC transporter substrate-binding protein, partial [Proteobacteria bacterium]|nr:ABC transporter substrate-binding protein [Pseudomonadota bacterium]
MIFNKRLFLFVLISSIISLSSCSKNNKDEENTLNVYSAEVVPGVDPITISDRYSHAVARQIYEGLYEYHYLKYPFTISPVLADGLPEVSKDGLTYTIKLKHGVFFADDPCFKDNKGKGRELVAQDFIYSIKRGLASTLTQSIFFYSILSDIVVGADDYRKISQNKKSFNFNKDIPGIIAVDKYTIQFKLKKTSAYFPGMLTRPNGFIVPKEAVEYYGEEFKNHPVGSGAFKITEWEKDSKIVFVKNPNYKHGFYPTEGEPGDAERGLLKDAGDTLPFLNKINMHILVEEQPRWLNFNRGLLDIVVPDKDSYYDAFPTGGELARNLADKGIKVTKRQKLEIIYYSFNMNNKTVGKNKYLRQAISLAYDGQKHNALFYNNQAFVSNWILPPNIFGFDPSYKNPYRQYNIAKARELMKKAGYPDGKGLPPLTMLITDSIAAKQIGEFFSKSVSELGVKINLQPRNFGLLLKELQDGRNFQIVSLQWRADLPCAEDFLRIFYSKAFAPGPNDSHFQNAEYDKLFEKASEMKEGPEKLKILNRMRDIAVEEAAVIPLVNPALITLAQPYVENYKPHILVGDVFKYVKIDNNKRDEIQK